MNRIALVAIIYVMLIGCKKNAVEVEENIAFDISAASTVINPASSFDIKITMKSKVPSWGLKAEVSASEDVGGAAVSPQPSPLTFMTSTTTVSVQNLPRQKWVTVQVKVSSTKSTTNSAVQSFKIIYK